MLSAAVICRCPALLNSEGYEVLTDGCIQGRRWENFEGIDGPQVSQGVLGILKVTNEGVVSWCVARNDEIFLDVDVKLIIVLCINTRN